MPLHRVSPRWVERQPAIAAWPAVVLRAHTEANSGQVQGNGPDNWLAGVWATLVGGRRRVGRVQPLLGKTHKMSVCIKKNWGWQPPRTSGRFFKWAFLGPRGKHSAPAIISNWKRNGQRILFSSLFFCWHAKIGWVRGQAVMFKERRWIRAGRGTFSFLKKLGQPGCRFPLFLLSGGLLVKPRILSSLYW